MAFAISEIRANLPLGGARPSQFNVIITNPITPVADIKIPFRVEAASLPPMILGTIRVPYFGRLIKEPGDRDFESWTTTVIEDEDFAIRNALETWNNAINALERNIATRGSAPANYQSQALVTQFGKDGSELRTYQFNNIWPAQISSIELNWATQNEIERFSVTWEYDTFEIVPGRTGNAGGT